MPSYRFRLRWRLEPGHSLKGLDQPLIVSLPESGECELKAIGDQTQTGGQDLALKSGAFEGQDAAKVAGEKLLAGLLLASIRQGFGLSVQPRIPTGGVTKRGKAVLGGDRFDTIHDDAYGLTVFEEMGRTGFVRVPEPRLLTGNYAARFCETWSTAVHDCAELDERTSISCDLYASSRFENSSRARFLLLVMAVEALAEQWNRSEVELALINRLMDAIAKAGLSQEQSAALLSGVGQLKRVSISHACRTYLTRSIAEGIVTDVEAARHFSKCYRTRGQIVHGGTTPSPEELTNKSNRIEKTIRELLTASLEGRAIRQQGV